MALENEQQGAVKRVFYTKGFGFITGDDGKEYFFHIYETRANFERLTMGDRVKFYAQSSAYKTKDGEEKEGFKAVRVRLC
jgi:cold shock CspA family protein